MNPVQDGISGNLKMLIQKSPGAMKRALYEFAQAEVMTEAKQRTPVDLGTLRDSGLVDQPVETGDSIICTLGFGGAAAHYAIYVHEDMDAHHKVGQAKFLESTLNDKAPMFVSYIGAAVARILGL